MLMTALFERQEQMNPPRTGLTQEQWFTGIASFGVTFTLTITRIRMMSVQKFSKFKAWK